MSRAWVAALAVGFLACGEEVPDAAKENQPPVIDEVRLTPDSPSENDSIGVAISPVGLGVSLTTATSNSDAVAIVSGSGSDTVTNSAKLVAVSTSNADSVGFSVAPVVGGISANSVWDGGVTANASSGGIRRCREIES